MNYYGLGMPARAPKSHQAVSAQIFKYLVDTFGIKNDDFVILFEANLDDGDETSRAPDITIFDLEGFPIICFQVSNLSGLAREKRINTEIMIDYPSIRELFIIVYKPLNLFDYTIEKIQSMKRKGKNPKLTDETDSEILGIDTSDIFNNHSGLAGLFS